MPSPGGHKLCTLCGCNKPRGSFVFPKHTVYNYCTDCRDEGKHLLVCGLCKKKWEPKAGASLKREHNACNECYIYWRKAVNLYACTANRAKKLKLDFDLTVKYIYDALLWNCPKTGLSFEIEITGRNYKTRHPRAPSVDKINPNKGYTTDNVQIVCWWYNCAKQQFTDDEVLDMCKAVVFHALP